MEHSNGRNLIRHFDRFNFPIDGKPFVILNSFDPSGLIDYFGLVIITIVNFDRHVVHVA